MHVYINQSFSGSQTSLGTPTLVYTDYCDEAYQLHTRNIHSHHNMVEILYILRGEGLYEIEGKAYPVHSGDLVIYNSDVVHNECLLTPPPPLYGFAVSGFRLEEMPDNCLISPDACPVSAAADREDEFRVLFQLLYEQSARQTPDSVEICQSLCQILLRMIAELAKDPVPAASAADILSSKSGRLGHQIQIYVDEHLTEDLSVQSVAEYFEISSTYLSRLFKRVVGTSMRQYIIRRRIGEAQTLLLVSDLPVKKVAEQVGYDNLSHFVKMFTKNVGISPLRYRKRGNFSGNFFIKK
ncbi:MAG: AraC family transcriptional regulator [Clostridiales bacterium]|nr:AraC family transcriptional regulator [Clostridiales bacterium]